MRAHRSRRLADFCLTPVGSCRVSNPVRIGAERYGYQINRNRLLGYCHSSAEALRQVKFLLGEATVPEELWPLIAPGQPYADTVSARHDLSDLYIVEISSAKHLSFDGHPIQLNYLRKAFPEFFADHETANAFWRAAQAGDGAEQQRIVGRADLPAAAQDLLSRVQLAYADQPTLRADVRTILSLLPRVLFVTHVDARKPNGTLIGSRSRLISDVTAAVLAEGGRVYDPTNLMEIYGQSEALEDDSAGLAHFTDQFSTALVDDWARRSILPTLGHRLAKARSKTRARLTDPVRVRLEAGTANHVLTRWARKAGLTDGAEYSLMRNGEAKEKVTSQDRAIQHWLAEDPGAALLAILEGMRQRPDKAEAARAIARLVQLGAAPEFAALPENDRATVLSQLPADMRLATLNAADLPPTSRHFAPNNTTTKEALTICEAATNNGQWRDAVEIISRFEEPTSADQRQQLRGVIDQWLDQIEDMSDANERLILLALLRRQFPDNRALTRARQNQQRIIVRAIRHASAAKDDDALTSVARTAASHFPGLPDLSLALARMHSRGGRSVEAYAHAIAAAREWPDKLNLRVMLMRLADQLGQAGAAADHARRVLDLSTDGHGALRNEARALLNHEKAA